MSLDTPEASFQTIGDIIDVARQLQAQLDLIDDAAFFESHIHSGLAILNSAPSLRRVAGATQLLMHADQAFQIGLDADEPDEIEFTLGKLEDVYCAGELRDIVWIGAVSVNGFAARLAGVRLYDAPHTRPRRINEPLTLPVKDIRSYLVAA
ncbi:MAG TPA: hypothetical protein VLE74_04090 [Candidatus Saccharimonadales bacterium]|nr:hypothetical protein [Candidatus Saccharimonadales bacterium]